MAISKSASTSSSSISSSHNSPGRVPETNLFTSDAEKRSFVFFETRACHDLGGYFHWQFWAREILQAAVHFPSTRHLVVAIGAAYEGFQTRSIQGPVSNEQSTDAMEFAIEQANQAIKVMGPIFDAARSQNPSTETTCNILTASILFAYLACLQGHVSQAVEHVRSGLKVLQSFEKTKAIEDPTGRFPISIVHLRSLLTSLYGQIRCMVNDDALAAWERDPLVSVVTPVLGFSSIADAHSYVESLWHNLLAFLQYTELHPPTTTDEFARFAVFRELLIRAMESSSQALEMLASQRTTSHDDQDESGFNILRLYHTLIGIRLRINPLEPGQREAAFDNLEADLQQMLQHCELIIRANCTTPKRSSFSSGLGYLMPLHTVAARCRNPSIRRRALLLLLSSGRREGIWDGILTGKIVTTTIEREGRVANLQTVPGDQRIREVKIEFLGERKARLRYITVADWRARLHGEQHILEW